MFVPLRIGQSLTGPLLTAQLPLKGEYKWGKRSMVLPANSSLSQVCSMIWQKSDRQLVNFGIQEIRYATDVVGVLFKELQTVPEESVLFPLDYLEYYLIVCPSRDPPLPLMAYTNGAASRSSSPLMSATPCSTRQRLLGPQRSGRTWPVNG